MVGSCHLYFLRYRHRDPITDRVLSMSSCILAYLLTYLLDWLFVYLHSSPILLSLRVLDRETEDKTEDGGLRRDDF